ncbi:MAG: taurine dioxygenase [Halieaceae bacterium]|jgi:taurine dioxygenase|nr:taurine dioxygenase [Halieaceae bacterium]
MQVKRIAGALGAEIKGVDLGQTLTPEISSVIRDLLNEHEVLFFRRQAIEPAQQRDLASIFGPLQTHPAYGTVEGIPEVMILESTADKPSKIEVWHSDMTFRQHPPSVTVLRGMVIPNVGGDTLFASMTSAYDALSDGMKVYLDGLVAVHDFAQGFRESLAEPGGRERLGDALAENPPVRHPVVQVHPETGKKVLFVNALFTTHIEGLPPLESSALLDFLCQHAALPEHTCRFQWTPDSVVLWDNRSTQHKPVNDFLPAPRCLHRVVSEGDQPY